MESAGEAFREVFWCWVWGLDSLSSVWFVVWLISYGNALRGSSLNEMGRDGILNLNFCVFFIYMFCGFGAWGVLLCTYIYIYCRTALLYVYKVPMYNV
ncbi:hypothetical protein F4861DRAFT_267445 [Xylaria intraflava]|nr:hypothetical protein F4861DRAFT_267445 [Xylaria intraflava]